MIIRGLGFNLTEAQINEFINDYDTDGIHIYLPNLSVLLNIYRLLLHILALFVASLIHCSIQNSFILYIYIYI